MIDSTAKMTGSIEVFVLKYRIQCTASSKVLGIAEYHCQLVHPLMGKLDTQLTIDFDLEITVRI